MAVQDVLRSLIEQWDDVLDRLSQTDRGALIELIQLIKAGAADGAVDEEADEALDEVAPLLLRSLPRDDPFRAVLRSGLRLAPADRPFLPPDLLARLADLPGLSGPQTLTPELIWAQARRRLLKVPSLTPDLLAAVGLNPDQGPLIRLSDDDGAIRIPSFQFGVDGVPLPVVLRINQVLDADDDPWGVADWWLSVNPWLQGAPAAMLGQVDDAVLIATATTLAEG